MNADDFPPIAKPDPGAARLTLEASVLSSLIEQTQFSVSTDETRAHMNSLLVTWNGDIVRAVSTDGHRLSKAERKVPGQTDMTLLIPLKSVREILTLASSATGTDGGPPTIGIIQAGPFAFFLAGTAVFSVRLVDATFPPWAQVIPKKSALKLRAPRAALADAIRAVSVASGGTSGVRMSLSKGKILLSSESPDAGNGNDEISVEYAGGNLAIGMNAKYPLDVFGVMTSDEVILEFEGELDPMVIRPAEQAEGCDYVAILMPMRI